MAFYCFSRSMRMLFALIVLSNLVGLVYSRPAFKLADVPTTKVYTLPPATFPENINVRKNGDVLISTLTQPEIYQIAPNSTQDAFRVYRFYNYTSVFAIVELQQDLFYSAVGNFSLDTLTGQKGSFSIWEVDLRGVGTNEQLSQCQMVGRPGVAGCRRAARVRKIVDAPQIKLLDGMTVLNPGKGLFIAGDSDSSVGQTYVIDVRNREVRKAFAAPELALTSGGLLGVNGLKHYHDTLFFTNSAKQTFGRVKLDSNTGKPQGPVEVLIRNVTLDDFIFDKKGNLFAGFLTATGGIAFSPAPVRRGSTVKKIAANIPGVTATHFGRTKEDYMTLYATDNGGVSQYFSGNFTSPGGLWAVDASSLNRG